MADGLHTTELQVRWSWHEIETSTEAGGNTEEREILSENGVGEVVVERTLKDE